VTPVPPLTDKGKRAEERLLQAATVVLAREGVGGASVAAIAEEAGLAKRMVTYYFGTREALLVRVVHRIGEEIFANVSAAIDASAPPGEAAGAGFDALWEGITSAPHLPAAYFALLAGTRGGEGQDALDELRRTFADLVTAVVTAQAAAGRELVSGDPEVFALLVVALIRGLLLEWIERGDTPALTAGRREATRLVATAFRASRA
jgi:AcrR family transcriptional regulator